MAIRTILGMHLFRTKAVVSPLRGTCEGRYSLGMVICSSKRFVLNSFGLSAQDLKLCYLIRARLCNKAIAVITPKSVLKTKQRIKNKIGLSGKDNLDRYVQQY